LLLSFAPLMNYLYSVWKTNCVLFLPQKANISLSPNILFNGSVLDLISKRK
jgi:hypothetical protein